MPVEEPPETAPAQCFTKIYLGLQSLYACLDPKVFELCVIQSAERMPLYGVRFFFVSGSRAIVQVPKLASTGSNEITRLRDEKDDAQRGG